MHCYSAGIRLNRAVCEYSIAILCGGRSSRFGKNKCFFRMNGRELFLIVRDRLRHLSDDIFLQGIPEGHDATAMTNEYSVRVEPDTARDRCALAGILSALRNSMHRHCLVVGCDMPFIDPSLVRFLASHLPADAVVPQWRSGFQEPLCSIYSRELSASIERRLDSGNMKISPIFSEFDVKFVDVDELMGSGSISADTFRNVNTPADVEC